jgi:hypothetical protein
VVIRLSGWGGGNNWSNYPLGSVYVGVSNDCYITHDTGWLEVHHPRAKNAASESLKAELLRRNKLNLPVGDIYISLEDGAYSDTFYRPIKAWSSGEVSKEVRKLSDEEKKLLKDFGTF